MHWCVDTLTSMCDSRSCRANVDTSRIASLSSSVGRWSPTRHRFASLPEKRSPATSTSSPNPSQLAWPPLETIHRPPSLHLLLTPKIGIGKGLTCGPSLVTKCHSPEKNPIRGFGKGACGRQYAIIRQKDCLHF
jgi:hypothetical protein